MPIYLDLAGVIGESKDKEHKGWIELDGCSVRGGTGDRRDRPQAEISCTRKGDSTSVMLSKLSAIGTMQAATIEFVSPQGDKYLQLNFQDASIVDHSFSNAAGSGPPVEVFSMIYAKVSVGWSSPSVDPAVESVRSWFLGWGRSNRGRLVQGGLEAFDLRGTAHHST